VTVVLRLMLNLQYVSVLRLSVWPYNAE